MIQQKCNYCQIDRKRNYIGGGVYTWTCPKCGSKMESNVADEGGRSHCHDSVE